MNHMFIKPQDQVYNPFLPLEEYIPDGEPHVFGDRVYLFGSHDKEGGETFCMLDYTVYSAPVSDLAHWRREGVIYHAGQDPDYECRHYMYAPDVVQGNDGRFYLYYCMSGDYGQGGYWGPIQVAVCDSPAGSYEYLGYVRNPDGTPYNEHICFDPAVLNDNGRIYLYSGTQYDFEERKDFYENEELIAITKELADTLRRNKTIDWQKRESARAKMRMLIKKLLKKHKYPPEGMEDAVQTVMTQCELWTDNNDMGEEKVVNFRDKSISYAEANYAPMMVAEGTATYGEKK